VRLYPRKKRNGERVWWAAWTEDKITKRRSTKCSTRSAAELVVARWERERADPVYSAAQNATFGEEAGRFLRACEGAVARRKMAGDTLGMYGQKAGTLVRSIGKGTRLASFDATTFQVYLETRRAEFLEDRERPITESTLYKEWVTFRQILKQAWREQRFGRDGTNLRTALAWFSDGVAPVDRWQRGFALSAARAAIFNAVVARRVVDGTWNRLLPGEIVNLDGSGLEQVTFNVTFDGFPMFSPDGRHLVFASNRNAKSEGETNVFIAEWVE
jgi:hypothetical protein